MFFFFKTEALSRNSSQDWTEKTRGGKNIQSLKATELIPLWL